MKVVGFITEYNPFHYGHKFHLETSLSKSNSTHSLAIMSGSFVQRGEPSIVDKWTKAKMAIDNGVDLVIELPFIYSTQSAELFAFGAVSLMNSLNMVDYISFGSEINDLNPLKNIAEVLLDEPKEYKRDLRKYLSKGLSFPGARSIALGNHFKGLNNPGNYDYKNILKQSNNILGIEYLKALQQLKSDIKPITIPRIGSNYKDEELNTTYASATAIRKSMLEEGIDSVKNLVPGPTYDLLLQYKYKYKIFNTLDNYEIILRYLLINKNPNDIEKFFDVVGGLENRIIQQNLKSKDIANLVDNITTKRYPRTRIQRILIHILHGLKADIIKSLYKETPPYIRILGSNKKGYEILKSIKDNSNIPIINKFANHANYNSKVMDDFIHFEERATDIYFLGLNPSPPLVNLDYKISQYNNRV